MQSNTAASHMPELCPADEARQSCWRMLASARLCLDLGQGPVLAVAGPLALEHASVLARQMLSAVVCAPHLLPRERGLAKVLWLAGLESAEALGSLLELPRKRLLDDWDAVVVLHSALDSRELIALMDGFARIGAQAHHAGTATSIFGRGLERPLFRPPARLPVTPRLVSDRSRAI
jgi:hypothetical protein